MHNFYTNISLNLNELFEARLENRVNFPLDARPGQIFYLTQASNGYAANNPYIYNGNSQSWDNLVQNIANAMELIGSINASTNPPYPSAPKKGDVYLISQAGTVGGIHVEAGFQLIYDGSQWIILQTMSQMATNLVMGYIRIATAVEARAGIINDAAITPQLLNDVLSRRRYEATVNLVANTPFSVLHNLILNNPAISATANVFTDFYDANGAKAWMPTKKSNANTLILQSNQSISGKIICSL